MLLLVVPGVVWLHVVSFGSQLQSVRCAVVALFPSVLSLLSVVPFAENFHFLPSEGLLLPDSEASFPVPASALHSPVASFQHPGYT